MTTSRVYEIFSTVSSTLSMISSGPSLKRNVVNPLFYKGLTRDCNWNFIKREGQTGVGDVCIFVRTNLSGDLSQFPFWPLWTRTFSHTPIMGNCFLILRIFPVTSRLPSYLPYTPDFVLQFDSSNSESRMSLLPTYPSTSFCCFGVSRSYTNTSGLRFHTLPRPSWETSDFLLFKSFFIFFFLV